MTCSDAARVPGEELASAMAGKHLMWTMDKQLARIASRVGVFAAPAHLDPK
jgi:hypothetical protein